MTTSIDGKVTGDFLEKPECENAIDIYYEINRAYKADAFACGRVTMESSFTGGVKADFSQVSTDIPLLYEDFVADTSAGYYAISFDRLGRVGWSTPIISDEDPGYDKAHIIEVLSTKTPPENLSYYQKTGISYIFAGDDDIDINVALKKLYKLFNIQKLLLEGGSIINGAFYNADMIDELSLVIAPVTADTDSKPLFFNSKINNFELKETKNFSGNTVWLNYIKKYS